MENADEHCPLGPSGQSVAEHVAQPPVNELIGRVEDMSQTGRLVVLRQDDGDYCVSIVDASGVQADVEFCLPGSGGGRSPRTLEALRALAVAMLEDNRADPRRAWRR